MAVNKTVETKTATNRLQEYEMVFIVNPELEEEPLENQINAISQFITGHGGTVDAMDKWGKKRLAYPLSRFLEGNYVLARFKMDPAHCKELEANLKITESVLRHLLIKVGD